MSGIDSISAVMKRLSLGDLLVRRNPVFYGRARRWLAKLERATLDERRTLVYARLQKTLSVAAQTAYGRSVGGSTDLAAWPLLEKQTLRERASSLHTGPGWMSGQASTSGTTGLQVHLRRSFESMAVEQFYIDQVIERLGADPRTVRTAILRGEYIKSAEDRSPPFWTYSGNGRRMHMSCSHLGPDTLRDYAKALQEFKPQVLWVYPSNMEWLCHLLTQAGIEFKVPHVLSSSEVLGSTAWRMAQEVLGANVADYYGQAERVGFGYAMAHGQFHFTPGYALVELVPVEGDTTNRLREIVGTTLWNHAMPLVRYRSGDLVELPENCSATQIEEICLGLRPVTGVLGRTVEFMVSPAGSILNGVGNFTKNTQHIVRLQVQQDELARIAVHLLVEPGFSATDLQQVERNVRDNISPGMQFSVEVVTELTRTAVGKTPLVIHGPAIKQYLTEHNLIGGRR